MSNPWQGVLHGIASEADQEHAEIELRLVCPEDRMADAVAEAHRRAEVFEQLWAASPRRTPVTNRGVFLTPLAAGLRSVAHDVAMDWWR